MSGMRLGFLDAMTGSIEGMSTAWRGAALCHRTITDLEMENNVLGTSIAAVSVVSSGMQQILCRTMQQKHNLASHELLANTAPAQVSVLSCSSCPTIIPRLGRHKGRLACPRLQQEARASPQAMFPA